MDRPRQRAICPTRQCRPSRQGLAGFLGLSFLLLLPGCAQLDQLMGKMGMGTESVEPAPSVPDQEKITTHPAKSEVKPVAKTPHDVQPAKAATESLTKTPVAAPARPPTTATGAAIDPEPEIKKTEQDKALVEKDQTQKEKKSRAASERKSKHIEKHIPSTEDAFLPPVPPPSKPAAIGGSGG